MNRSKIDWCDYTYNPITGCRHGCSYCYARRMVKRFAGNDRLNLSNTDQYRIEESEGEELYILDQPFLSETGKTTPYPFGFRPTLHNYRFRGKFGLEQRKMGANIFVGSMSDIFGEWVPFTWTIKVLDYCMNYPIHNYLFLTKNPKRYIQLAKHRVLPKQENMWFGTTVTGNCDRDRGQLLCTEELDGYNRFLSVEPMRAELHLKELGMLGYIDWVIVGAEGGNNRYKIKPKRSWIERIVDDCAGEIPVYMKSSLEKVWDKELIQIYPNQLQQKKRSEKVAARMEGTCSECGRHMDKNKMITLSAKSDRKEMPKKVGYTCHSCFLTLCKKWDVNVPDLEVYR